MKISPRDLGGSYWPSATEDELSELPIVHLDPEKKNLTEKVSEPTVLTEGGAAGFLYLDEKDESEDARGSLFRK